MNLNKELFLAAAMAFSLAACGGDEAPEEEETTGAEDTYVAPAPQPAPQPVQEPIEPMDEPVDYAPVEE